MNQKKSLLSKLVLSVGLPIGVIFLIVAGLVVSMGNQSNSALIFGIGFVAMLGVFILSVKGISNKLSELTLAASRLAKGNLDTVIAADHSQDQLGELSEAFAEIAENIRTHTAEVKKLAEGDMTVDIITGSEKDILGTSLMTIRDSINRFAGDTAMLVEWAESGEFSKRDPATDLVGAYQKAVLNTNQVMDIVVDKMQWYEAILDAIPFPVHVIDNDMNWTFLNKPFSDLMIANGVINNRDAACGMPCSSANADICNTEGCGIRRLVDQGLTDSYFEWVGRNNKQDTAYLINKKGEKVGYVEIVTDLTSIISVNEYSNTEIKRLEENLLRLAEGDLDLDTNIAPAGEYTREVYRQFSEIGDNLAAVKKSIGNLINDATMLTKAAIDGELDTRADAGKFKGAWEDLVGGMNNILDEIAKPTREVAKVMVEMAKGFLHVEVSGTYKGEFDELVKSVNYTAVRIENVVQEMSVVTGEIEKGNLNLEQVRDYGGDFHKISNDLNGIITSLNKLLGDISDAAQQVTAGSAQVSMGSQSLAQGSTEQASSIQELTASITEVADQTKANAMNANKAKELAMDVRENAAKGNAQMTEMQGAMVEINQSSQDISKIIKVIDDIAFQTNILALNAAVEAARAGQHGKGFAVVAEEVRTLAARSAEAAKETTVLIEGSINKVQHGTKIADDTAAALDEIVGGIGEVTDLVGNIAVASNEQATGIAQINTGIEQVAQVVQQNSATAEQSAAASEELSSQAEMLKEMINQFELKRR
nr:methyl-accepting chemotaxis protein [uncultured Acetobacterium sp.]